MSEVRVVQVEGQPVRVHVLGQGEPLLLLHGGWAGAEAHWGRVWERLAERYQVFAPELPGIMQGQGLATLADYARWVVGLLGALGLERVWCVGNSLGADIGRGLAAREPGLVRGLVLVNGGGVLGSEDPATGRVLKLPGGRRLLRWMIRHNSYSPKTVRRAFADPGLAPAEMVRTVTHPEPRLVDLMLELYARGDPGVTAPQVPTLVVWGREDHLIGFSPRTGEAIAGRIPGAKLAFIDKAGHLPQAEQPAAFIDAVEGFITSARAS